MASDQLWMCSNDVTGSCFRYVLLLSCLMNKNLPSDVRLARAFLFLRCSGRPPVARGCDRRKSRYGKRRVAYPPGYRCSRYARQTFTEKSCPRSMKASRICRIWRFSLACSSMASRWNAGRAVLRRGLSPAPGRHQLALMDESGKIVDQIRFEVRGLRRSD